MPFVGACPKAPLIVPGLESVIEREVHARESRRHNRRRAEPVRASGRITVVAVESGRVIRIEDVVDIDRDVGSSIAEPDDFRERRPS